MAGGDLSQPPYYASFVFPPSLDRARKEAADLMVHPTRTALRFLYVPPPFNLSWTRRRMGQFGEPLWACAKVQCGEGRRGHALLAHPGEEG